MSLPTVAVVAFNHFSPFHFSVPCIVFGNVLAGTKLFDLRICAGEEGQLHSDIGLQIQPDHGLDELGSADIIVIPFWRAPSERPSQKLLDSLNQAHERGALIVGLCLGTYVLAYAGLLDNQRASTHWEFEQDFVSRFPDVILDTNALYIESNRLITSAGTAAGLDCCLHLVRQFYGSKTANKIARRLVVPPHREGGQAQFIEQPVPVSTQDARINQLLDYLGQNLNAHHDLDSLAAWVNMSRRSFTRHFLKATGETVGDWLIAQRLRRSQLLLETTSYSIERIAELVGFQSAVSLRQHFKTKFEISPKEWRRNFRGEEVIL
ncbi:helix-turn-helix domain-containing protein [Microvirga sp. W0021]|uniref:Helix-turn-helix domain-containing protein n=1 Tax=Hohaiivirga grylli TaxID=3133970 RepID=A0ABV0BFC1_9HYPH